MNTYANIKDSPKFHKILGDIEELQSKVLLYIENEIEDKHIKDSVLEYSSQYQSIINRLLQIVLIT